jgi:hypothetical protein
VGSGDGWTVGDEVGSVVASGVGSTVGSDDGSTVGSVVGAGVGSGVASSEGSAVGPGVAVDVASGVGVAAGSVAAGVGEADESSAATGIGARRLARTRKTWSAARARRAVRDGVTGRRDMDPPKDARPRRSFDERMRRRDHMDHDGARSTDVVDSVRDD